MKRRMLLICIAALLLAGVWTPAGVFADADHPISMTILIDPDVIKLIIAFFPVLN